MYTVFPINSDNEQLGDALLVRPENLAAAIEALITYWDAEAEDKAESVHCEVHDGSVRDHRNFKPLPWTPGHPVVDPDLVGEA